MHGNTTFDAVALDLETLGTDPGDAILSIGMVEFNSTTGQQGEEFFCSFDETEWLKAGYTARESTRAWWADPKQDAARAFLSVDQLGMQRGLTAALEWIKTRELSGGLWSRGYMDETMLKLAIRRELGIEDPWHYRAASDARTMLRVIERFDDMGFFGEGSIPFVGVPHHALDDAKHEAKLVASALQVLRVSLGTAPITYHDLAMRTAAGPEVHHLPSSPEDRRSYELEFLSDLFQFLVAASKLDNHKSRQFYGKTKPVRDFELFKGALMPAGTQSFRMQRSGFNPQVVHAVLGLATESSELVEDLIKLMSGTAATDDLRSNMSRESGDIDWYQELFASAIGVPVEQSREENIARLAKRFPDKFSEAHAIARADEA